MVVAFKLEMMENPCNDVTPIPCIVKLTENEAFNKGLGLLPLHNYWR